MKKVFKYSGLLVLLQLRMLGQDFQLSMYDAAPLFLNPAMTGLMESKMRLHAQFRNQWNVLAYKPFTTSLISYDMPKGKWGFGGQIVNMRAGAGNYNVLQILGSVGYSLPIDKLKQHNLAFGLQAGLTQKSLTYKLLSFDAQYTTANGGGFDPNVSNNENFGSQFEFQEAVNFGMLYYFSKQQTRFNPFAGLSIFNLTTPKESFIGSNNRLPRRYYFHVGSRINVNEIFYFIPKALVYYQSGAFQQTYSLDAGYFFKGEKFYALAGFTGRMHDANIIYAGIKKDNYIIKMSYDFNTSTLRNVTKTRGAYEISITWLGPLEKTDQIKQCPRL